MNAVSQCDRKPFAAQDSSCLRCSRKRDVHLVGVIAMQCLNTSFSEKSAGNVLNKAAVIASASSPHRTTNTENDDDCTQNSDRG
jgi:hypothetical protein